MIPVNIGGGTYIDWSRVLSIADYRQRTATGLSAVFRRLEPNANPNEIVDATSGGLRLSLIQVMAGPVFLTTVTTRTLLRRAKAAETAR